MKKLFILTAILTAMSAAANAQPLSFDNGNLYGSVNAGLVVPEDMKLSYKTAAYETRTTLSFKDGYSLTGTAGMHLNPYFAPELEVGYSRVSYDRLSGSLNGAPVNLRATGRATAWHAVANGIVTPFPSWTLSPYFGGGLGVARTSAKFDEIETLGRGAGSEKHTNLAADLIAGFNVPVNDQFSLGLRYQYFWIHNKEDITRDGYEERAGNSAFNVFSARAVFKF